MSIKQNGGVFGRNPTFNDVTVEGNLIINGEVFTGLDFQGSWNASTNSPSLSSGTGTNGEFYIVSVAGTTNLNGITNWGIGDWAIFNGTVWQRVEGGADGNFDDVTVAGTLVVGGEITANGGIALGDNDKATFGASDDLEIYHDGTNSHVKDAGTGSLLLQGDSLYLMNAAGNLTYFYGASSTGAAQLRYGNSPKLATTSGGINVTGEVAATSLDISGNIDVDGVTNLDVVDIDGAVDMATTALFSKTAYGAIGSEDFYRIKFKDHGGVTNDVGIGQPNFDSMGFNFTPTGTGGLFFTGGTVGEVLRLNSGGAIFNEAGADLDFRVKSDGNANMLFVDGGNNRVGIGTSSPSANLHVLSAGNGEIEVERTSGALINIQAQSAKGIIGTDSNHDLSLKTNGGVRLTIDPSGLVGIGTNDPTAQLHLSKGGGTLIKLGTSQNTSEIEAREVGTSNSLVFSSNGSVDHAIIDSGGNLLVGTGTAGYASQSGVAVNPAGASFVAVSHPNGAGNGNSYALFTYNAGIIGSITQSGTTGVAYNTSSDYRLKEDDVPMTGATERVKALRPINFAWKADGSRIDGFFAHEAGEIVPECVSGTKDAMVDEEYEVTAPVYEDVITLAVEAVEGVEAVEAIEAVDSVYDEEGLLVSEAIEAVESVEGVDAVEAQAETTESVLVTEAVMGTRSVPDYQGIDQSKLVPLLTATIQELIARIETLEGQ